jgi:AraC family transcriptional regulator
MTREHSRHSYEDRLNRVLNYIYDHLDDDLDLDVLADVAAMSPYHWHRVYLSFHGESVSDTVRRLRLQRAAYELTQTAHAIEVIASRAGYGSAAAFNRAFASAFAMPPGQYRKERNPHIPLVKQKGRDLTMYDVKTEFVPALTLAAINHSGPYLGISRAFQSLFGTLASRGLIGPRTRMIGLYYDDPDSVPAEKLRSKAGATADKVVALDAPLELLEHAPGEFATIIHKGPYSELAPVYRWLFGEWLMSSARELDNRPSLEEYLNSPMETPPAELLTKIYMPLKT